MDNIGRNCSVLGTDIVGVVVGLRRYLGSADRQTVRYLDASGGKQEREFIISELSFDLPVIAEAA